MMPIPPKLREQLSKDPYYKKCAITGTQAGKIDWHHNLIFGGRQVQEKFCIIPLSKEVHDNIVRHKEKVDWIMWNRATDDEVHRYSKAIDYFKVRDMLNKKYGPYTDKAA